MPKTPPSLDFDYRKGFEIPTKHKEAIRQLHWFGHVPVSMLQVRYKLGESSVRRILSYDYPERKHQPPTEAQMEQAVTEEWEAIPQEWINQLVLKHDHWVHVLAERRG